jgi:hypothetical protein
MSIILEYPWWFLIFCIACGALYAYVLYRGDRKLDEAPRWAVRAMGALRFAAVTFLAFLLLSPLIKTTTREVEKPVIIIAQDNSESVRIGKDSMYYRNEYPKALGELLAGLSDKYDTNTYSFSDKVEQGIHFGFNGKQTDISTVFDEIETRFANRNVGAVIIASDGLYNKGVNPVFSSSRIKVPVYTIALGDTNVKKDVVITNVVHNRYAYLGNSFPLEIVAEARKYRGQATTLTVSKGSQVLFTQTLTINSDAFITTVPVQVDATQPGLQRYHIRLSPLEGEVSYTNNEKDVFIEVLDGRQKVLILASAPHPDVAALKETIEGNENYEVESALLADFKGSIKGYNLIILHQVPSSANSSSALMSEIARSEIPVLYIVGSQTQFAAFNNLGNGLKINSNNRTRSNDALALVSKDFTLFTLSDEARAFFPKLPPLQTPFGSFMMSSAANPLLYQRIGMVDTKDPLIVFTEELGRKQGVIAGEGLWKWKLFDYAEHSNHNFFNELVSKMIQYLSVKVDKSLFRVKSRTNFYDNEPVEIEAELYNQSYELINDPEVTLNIVSSDDRKFPFTFTKTAHAYRLDAGVFPVGEYKYEAKTKVGEKIYTATGEFSVTALQVESANTTADHQLLYSLAKKHGGEMVYPSELKKLADLINAREDVKPVSYTEKKLNDLVNLKWVFFLLLGLLTAEWFMRKRNGAY